jgi:type I restriction enzyme S subunit
MDDSWSPVNLGDIYTPGRGISYSANDLKDVDGTGLPFITIKNFNKGGGFNHKGLKTYSGPDFPQHRLVTAALLIANTDVTRDAEIIGAPLLVPKLDDQPLFSMDVNQLTQAGKIGCVDPQYIFFRLCIADARSHMQRVSAGSTVLHLNVKDALKFKFDLPPVQEQTKIAQILGTLDAQIQKTEALITKLEKIKEGLLHDMLTRGIDQNGQLRPTPEQAPELYKASALVLIPMEWDIRTTGEISRSIVPGRDKPQLSNTGIPWITISDLIENRVAKSMLGLYVDERQIRTSMIRTIPAGSVIMSCVGEFGVTSITECKTIINQQLHCFIVNTGINADWLMYSLRQKKNTIDRSATQTTIKYLNKAGCESIVLPTPSLDEQISIVSQISSLDRRIGKEKKYSDKLGKTKVGLMDDLLTGRVRVTPLLKDAV